MILRRFLLLSLLGPACFFLFAFLAEQLFGNDGPYWAVKVHDHKILKAMQPYAYSYISAGRVQIVTLKDAYGNLPAEIRAALEPIDPKVMSTEPMSRAWMDLKLRVGLTRPDPYLTSLVARVRPESLEETMADLVSLGSRSSEDSIRYVKDKFTELGYVPIHDYNIEAVKIGTSYPDEWVFVVGHMDTVENTVGADDNASGAAGVLEVARVLAGETLERSVLFLVTEDEERGLLGAKEKVARLRQDGALDRVKFVVNMDMIAYNSNGIVDLETRRVFEPLADWMAEQTMLYTSLRPNKVLHAWGSDHVPFIDAGVPCLLTIEHWKTHTPCWHKSCDTMDTVNFGYAAEIVRLNVAALAQKAGLLQLDRTSR